MPPAASPAADEVALDRNGRDRGRLACHRHALSALEIPQAQRHVAARGDRAVVSVRRRRQRQDTARVPLQPRNARSAGDVPHAKRMRVPEDEG